MAYETEQFDLPGPLGDALRKTYTHRVEISSAVDQAVLGEARAKFAQRRRMRLLARWGTGLAAGIAAMIVVVVWLHHPAANHVVVKGDIDGDGKVNIVDALVLAKHIAGKDKTEPAWDVNGDGVVDQKDVDALAQVAVSLKGGGVAQGGLPKLGELGIARIDGGHVVISRSMPTPADIAIRNIVDQLTAGEGMAPGGMSRLRNTIPFAEANPTKNEKEGLR